MENDKKNTFSRHVGLVPVVKQPVVIVVSNHVQNAHLFSTPVEYKQVLQSECSAVSLLVFLEFGAEYQEGFLTANDIQMPAAYALDDIFEIETFLHSMWF